MVQWLIHERTLQQVLLHGLCTHQSLRRTRTLPAQPTGNQRRADCDSSNRYAHDPPKPDHPTIRQLPCPDCHVSVLLLMLLYVAVAGDVFDVAITLDPGMPGVAGFDTIAIHA